MTDEPWEELYRYWLSKHGNGRPPGRRDIDPLSEIPHLAANLILIEVLPQGCRYRLMGTTAARHFKVDMMGRYVGTAPNAPAVITAWVEAVEFVAVNGKPRLMVAQYSDRTLIKNVIPLLPLFGQDGKTEQILAGSFSDNDYLDDPQITAMSGSEIDF